MTSITQRIPRYIALGDFIMVVFLAFLFPLTSISQVSTQWRGADRRGIYPDTGLQNSWPAEGPMLIRVYEGIGNGYGSPTVAGDILYITGEVNDTAFLFTFDPDGNLVFITPGGPDTNVVALDRFTGDIRWVCKGNGERSGYNSPVLIHLPKRDILVLFTAYSFLGIDTRNGKLLWSHDQVNIPPSERKPGNGDTHSNSAWYEDGFIYYIAGDGNGSVKLELLDDGTKIRQVWRNKGIDNYMGGFVILNNISHTPLSTMGSYTSAMEMSSWLTTLRKNKSLNIFLKKISFVYGAV